MFEVEGVHIRSLATSIVRIIRIQKCFRLTDPAWPVLWCAIGWGRCPGLFGVIGSRFWAQGVRHLFGVFEIATPWECCRGIIDAELREPFINLALAEGARLVRVLFREPLGLVIGRERGQESVRIDDLAASAPGNHLDFSV